MNIDKYKKGQSLPMLALCLVINEITGRRKYSLSILQHYKV